MRRALLIALCLSLLMTGGIACSRLRKAPPVQPASAPAGTLEVVILHVNDTHGQIEGTGAGGGYPRLASAVEAFRATSKAERVLLVDCGDVLSRGDDLTRRTLGAANFELMNYLKFDAWIPGNGDFYDGLAVLDERMRQARFPSLAANVLHRAGGESIARPYVIEQAGPVKIAIFGLCHLRINPQLRGIELVDPIETAGKLVPELRKQADAVVAMTHIGVEEDQKLARKVPGIDLILGGHSHTYLPRGVVVNCHAGGSALVCQAGEQLNFLGAARLRFQPVESPQGRGAARAGGAGDEVAPTSGSSPARPAAAAPAYKLVSVSEETIPLDQSVKIDPRVKALIARLAAPASQPVRLAPVGG